MDKQRHLEYTLIRLDEARAADIEKLKQEFFAKHRAVAQSGRIQYVLTRDMSGKSKFRITSIDDRGPIGHICYDHFSNAMHDLASCLPHRADMPPEYLLSEPGEFEHVYASTLRPVGPGAIPKDGLIRTEAGGKFGHAVYGRVLTKDELEHFNLEPVAYISTKQREEILS
jgi:hypothetical protein